MEFTGTYSIPASREAVWDALNDPEILKACIPGCEAMAQQGDNQFEATVFAKVGPVQARFKGKVSLENLEPPTAYDLKFDGSGGVAGFAKGDARISLETEGNNTVMTYQANAKIGGKLAQIGQRLVDSSAKKMADDFFSEFCRLADFGFDPEAEKAAEQEAEKAAKAEAISSAEAAASQSSPREADSASAKSTYVIAAIVAGALIVAGILLLT
jgi:carbon monoxide dehydrogenase subunit G